MINIEDIKQTTEIIASIFAKGSETPDFNVKEVLEGLKIYFDDLCAVGGKFDPRPPDPDDKAKFISRIFSDIAMDFAKKGLEFAAQDLLLYMWDKFNLIQSESKKKIYKGTIAIWLVILYQKHLKDIGASTRWALLTHADDGLIGHIDGEGGRRLQYSFGMSKNEISDFQKIIKAHQNAADWSQLEGFADDMIVQFALKYPQYSHLFAMPTSVVEFPVCKPYLKRLLENINKPSLDTSKKGNALEYLAAYLFLLIPGFIPRKKVVPDTKDFENDIVVSNLRSAGNLEAELFGRDFLVECKNWEGSVGVSEVGYFLYRMKLTHTKFGVLFAKNGISGKEDKFKYARNLCQRAFHEDGSLCIVIDERELQKIIEGQTTFRSILFEEVNKLRFGISTN